MDETLLSLPVFVSNFAEAQITSEMYSALTAVLCEYFKKEFAKLYERCQNTTFVTNNATLLNTQVSSRVNELEGNFSAFMFRLAEAQQDLKLGTEVQVQAIESD